ncbi:hypothetical protein CKAN_00289200 [Cinnamomum micranthum f. kanehirae]|uniref:DUF7903 domain-containing protein n=1 Tax=Cinnamomum micranthum f. kanehirae TaxID=337451 RepID=A0A443N7Q5_9MAGN|nr:hypothetical protein CKAN_00289200 [Cinnamomum micranthum f. kanehirae]
MAYIPRHKRHFEDGKRPVPAPCSLIPRFARNLNLGSTSNLTKRKDQHASQGGKIVYSKNSISRWWAVGLTEDSHFSTSVRLEPISCEPFERRRGEKPLTLVHEHPSGETSEVTESSLDRPWLSIPEKIHLDFETSFQSVMNVTESRESEQVKPSFAARFGKLFFHEDSFMRLNEILKSSADDIAPCNQVTKTFYTNVSDAYMEAIRDVVVPKIGFDFESEKEHYHVKIYDKYRPNVTISCKCSVLKDGAGLELQKASVQLNQLRHLVADISCLDKDLDLRLMLSTKRILTALTDEEDRGIRELLKHAVLDPRVKAGLRWPPGKETFGDRFSVVGAWHTKFKSYRGHSMRLRLRDADRLDLRTSAGEVEKEVTLKMVGISKVVRDGMAETSIVKKMLQDNLKLIWDHFLSCKCSFS